MKYINILHASSNLWFLHQLDHSLFDREYAFFENSNKNIVWDMVIVYEGLTIPVNVLFKKGGLVFISGEPPMSNVYTSGFLNQFDTIITSHPNLRHSNIKLTQQSLPWHYGLSFKNKIHKFDYAFLKNLEVPEKTKNISVITSLKRMMPGHNRRIEFLNLLKEKFPNLIDYYGIGSNPIDDKADAILPYRFHICIENSQISDYWTEKLADPLLGYSIPIYIGCTNINKYFNIAGMYLLTMNDLKKDLEIIQEILDDPEKAYQAKLSILKNNRHKLLTQYNIFPFVDTLITKELTILNDKINLIIKPNSMFFDYKYRLIFLRFKRVLYKFIHYSYA